MGFGLFIFVFFSVIFAIGWVVYTIGEHDGLVWARPIDDEDKEYHQPGRVLAFHLLRGLDEYRLAKRAFEVTDGQNSDGLIYLSKKGQRLRVGVVHRKIEGKRKQMIAKRLAAKLFEEK